jgi:mycothiol synthase
MPDSPFLFRAYDPSTDLPRLLRLRLAIAQADQSPVADPEGMLRTQLSLPGHDPARDRIIVLHPDDSDQVIAYDLVWLPPGEQAVEGNVLVHPNWRRQGLGSALLQLLFEQARSLGASQANLYADYSHPAAARFLQRHGFKPTGVYTEMRAKGDIPLDPIVWPDSYQVRPYSEINNLAILTQAMNDSYQFVSGHHTVTQEQMAGWLPTFEPHGLFLVFSDENRPVGISRVEMSPERTARNGVPTGYIDGPGISLPYRRLDMYRSLLLTGVKYLKNLGCAQVELESWGDTQAVLGLYQELGFTILQQVITYSRSLT